MHDVLNAFLLVYAGLFPIVNPVGSAPIFLGLTAGCSDDERNVLARRVAINSVFLLIGSMFIGSHLLVFFGITLPVVRIGGGLVVATFGWKLLQSGVDADNKSATAAARESTQVDAFYPLTMPLTVGPGGISVAIALGSQRPAAGSDVTHLLLLAGAAIVGIVAAIIVVLVLIVGAVLAAIALPAYQEYVARSKTSEALVTLAPVKVAVAAFHGEHGRCPVNDDEGFQPADGYADGAINAVRIGRFDNGHCGVEAELTVPGNAALDGKLLWLDYNGAGHWECSGEPDDTYLPRECRG